MPYKGFGNGDNVYLPGRVIKDRGIVAASPQDSRWQNFRKMYKRFMSWEIPGVMVKATYLGMSQTVTSDDEGYFVFRFTGNTVAAAETEGAWQKIALELMEKVVPGQPKAKAEAYVFVPDKNVQYGIISDIDDTIVPTGATRLWEMLKTTFLGNAHSRLPFPGVATFYQAMEKGDDDIKGNPLFYVSSSPWNLYDFLTEWLAVHEVPRGPLMLRDIGLTREYWITGSHLDHKLKQVENIFALIPEISFILIGDSGQHDPEIYLQVIKDFPGRVKMIYIRDVAPERKVAVDAIARQIRALGVELLLIQDTVDAARHAALKGWITQDDIDEVVSAKINDEKAT